MISLIVATKKRPIYIEKCLRSVLNSSFSDFEIILIDQSNDNQTEAVITAIKSSKIKYFKIQQKGKARALNYAIRAASGDIVTFTDDDCVVSRSWLKIIYDGFYTHKNVDGIIGSVLPFQPQKHPHKICPAIFNIITKIIVSSINRFPVNGLGIGSNMSFRRSVFDSMGFFLTWLGPGVLHLGGGEEEEYIYRLLRNKMAIAYLPTSIVFHNRWLTYTEYRIQQSKYTCGEMAFNFYYSFRGDDCIKNILYKKIRDKIINEHIRPYLKQLSVLHVEWLIQNRASFIKEIFFSLLEAACITEGLLIAFFYGILSKNKP